MFGREEKVSPFRLTAVQYAILFIFLLLAYGLWRLQVMQSDKYSLLAEQNRVRNIPILAPRGKILDREGRIIVDNYPSFSALLLRDSARDLNADADAIAKGLHLNPEEVRQRIRHAASLPQYQPLFLKEDITPDELAFIEAHKNELPELDTIMAHRRLYPRNGFMAHLVGYVGEVSEDMLNQPQFELYSAGDVVGVSGVEKEYNNVLMGKNGSRRAIVNSRGREVGRLDETPAEPGKQLKLTVDLDLQIAAEEALEGKNGAIVAMDPRTGEILAMVSRPTFDPNNFAVKISKADWNKLVTDDDHPLLNKAIQAQLAPGSTFKIIMATAGLQEGIAQTMHVNCNGGGVFYGRYFKCWVVAEHRTHGVVDISKAIYQSCDVFFYTLAEKLGIERIAKWATALGSRTEDGYRSAAGSHGRDAIGRMEDQKLQAEMVRGRNDFCGHWPGRGGGNSDSDGARDRRDCQRRTANAAARYQSHRFACECDSGVECSERNARADGSTELGDDYGRDGSGCKPRGYRPERPSPGNRLRGKDRERADHQQRFEGKAGGGRKEKLQGQWLVRRCRAEAQSGDRCLHAA